MRKFKVENVCTIQQFELSYSKPDYRNISTLIKKNTMRKFVESYTAFEMHNTSRSRDKIICNASVRKLPSHLFEKASLNRAKILVEGQMQKREKREKENHT